MNPAVIGICLVLAVAFIGIVLAGRGGILKAAVRQPALPPLDLNHPLVVELSAELRALDALPITTKQERKDWDAARWVFDKKLRTAWRSIYDSLPHELEHYLSDVEIRAKDSGYAQHQRMQLVALLALSPKEPNQSPEPTIMSVTPPAAQEPRQP